MCDQTKQHICMFSSHRVFEREVEPSSPMQSQPQIARFTSQAKLSLVRSMRMHGHPTLQPGSGAKLPHDSVAKKRCHYARYRQRHTKEGTKRFEEAYAEVIGLKNSPLRSYFTGFVLANQNGTWALISSSYVTIRIRVSVEVANLSCRKTNKEY